MPPRATERGRTITRSLIDDAAARWQAACLAGERMAAGSRAPTLADSVKDGQAAMRHVVIACTGLVASVADDVHRRYGGRNGYAGCDREDVAQAAWMGISRALGNWDPAKAKGDPAGYLSMWAQSYAERTAAAAAQQIRVPQATSAQWRQAAAIAVRLEGETGLPATDERIAAASAGNLTVEQVADWRRHRAVAPGACRRLSQHDGVEGHSVAAGQIPAPGEAHEREETAAQVKATVSRAVERIGLSQTARTVIETRWGLDGSGSEHTVTAAAAAAAVPTAVAEDILDAFQMLLTHPDGPLAEECRRIGVQAACDIGLGHLLDPGPGEPPDVPATLTTEPASPPGRIPRIPSRGTAAHATFTCPAHGSFRRRYRSARLTPTTAACPSCQADSARLHIQSGGPA